MTRPYTYKNLRCLSLFATLVFCLFAGANPAQAQCPPAACWMTITGWGWICDNVGPSPPAFWAPSCTVSNDTNKTAQTIADWTIKAAQYAAEAEDWLTKNVTQNSIAPSIMAGQGAQTQAQVYMTQATVDGQRQAQQSNQMGFIQGHTTMSTTTIACATAKGNQARASGLAAARSMGQQVESVSQAVSMGVNGSAGSAASASTEVDDLCKLGFLSVANATTATRYGGLPGKKNCQDPSGSGKYVGADIKLSSVIDPLQYPLPAKDHVWITPDGHVTFQGKNKANPVSAQPADPGDATAGHHPDLGSEMDFAAAYKFCEHLMPVLPTPTVNSGTPTAADNVNIKMDRDFEALRTAAADECFRAIWYRMACPDGSDDTLKGINLNNGGAASNASCVTSQRAMCERLVWKAPDGLGLTMQGHDPRFTQALTNCTTAVGTGPTSNPNGLFLGLSPAMFDAIMAHKCDDKTYTGLAANVYQDTAMFEHVQQFDCPNEVAAYESFMRRERKRLEHEVNNVLKMQGIGAPTSQTSRITK